MDKEYQYLHSYEKSEQERLIQQAAFLENMIYERLDLSDSKNLLEIGCGTGAQTLILLKRFPQLQITAVDISEKQIQAAKSNLQAYPDLLNRVTFIHAEDGNLDEVPHDFDSAFVCFVLEHVPQPLPLLQQAHHHLIANGKIYITEVYNSSLRIHPTQAAIDNYWDAYNNYQTQIGGHTDIGLHLGELMTLAGFQNVHTQFVGQHHDQRNPEARSLMFDYFRDLMLSAKDGLLSNALIPENLPEDISQAFGWLKDHESSIFLYTAVQGSAQKQ